MSKIFIRLFLALTLLLAAEATAFPAGAKPFVSINVPGDGSEFLYDSDIPASVSVDKRGGELTGDVVASIDDGIEFTLELVPKDAIWSIILSGVSPGDHTLTVSATNSAGTGTAISAFKVFVNFGQWLPPVSETGKQMRPGSMLPVKFTITGAHGPLDNSIIEPEVLLNGKIMGKAETIMDSTTGLPYFQLETKLPDKSCQISVTDPNLKQGKQTREVTVR